jgi:signal transduction histidine kinase
LREYREQSERETWIKSGIAELAERMAGEQSVELLAQNAMTQVAGYTGASTAEIFVCDETGELQLAASMSGDSPAEPPVVVRLVHEGRTLGVLLLGMKQRPDDKTLELLARVASMIAIALRVAESREREHELLIETQRQARAAETANKELEAFSYSVSHDLRAPLRGIDGFSQALAEDEADRLSADGQKYLQRIRSAAQRMGELIDDLLRLSRVSRADFRRDEIDLSALAESVLAELRRADPERVVELVVQPDVKAHADVRLAKIALENLFGNAWKFTSKSPGARIEFGMRVEGGENVYFVRDNGAGFDMKYVKRLFGAFQRLHSDSDYPGTGIGLATVQRIVLRHGGRIWVDAAVGQGATFQFTLPS